MRLLDREREAAALSELLEAARRGKGGAHVLMGEPGVGLSTLLEHALDRASGVRILRIRGVRSERDLRFAALHELCVPMLDRLATLPDPQGNALESAFGLIENPVEDRLLVGLGVLSLLSGVAQDDPLICVIDDAQWLDEQSAEAMAFVARRVGVEPIAFVFATHQPAVEGTWWGGIDALRVPGVAPDASSKLLRSVISGPLDGGVRERLITETNGNPLALRELPAQLTPDQLAGLSALPLELPVGDMVRERFLDAVREMSGDTRALLLLAAAGHELPTSVLWNAAASLGLSAEAAAPAEAAGVLRLAQRITFRHPLIRLAIYDSAPAAERQRAHRALAEAVDPVLERDRRVWHRAAASFTADEDIALELEASADRAKGRGDYAAAADLLERAAGQTADASRRYERTLTAAQCALAAGALGRAASLLDSASAAPLDETQRAHAQRLRGVVSAALGRGADQPTVLLRAARALEHVDSRLARDSHLQALEAAICSAPLGRDGAVLEVAESSRSAAAVSESGATITDPLLDGLVLLITSGHAAAVPAIRRALGELVGVEEPRWLPLGVLAALETWDDDALHALANRQAELMPTAGASASLPLALASLGDLEAVVTGRFAVAPVSVAEERDPPGARVGEPGSTAELIGLAWRGHATETREMAEASMRKAFARELGLHVAFAHQAVAVLELGLCHYEAALTAARAACEEPGLCVATSGLPDLIEAAVRAGEREVGIAAVGRLSDRAGASDTRWARGMLARSRALLEEGARAEELYLEAIEHLRRSRATPQLARAHLVFGEWLRRERRRRDAREQLRTARDMFTFMGAQAFAERARGELNATGERARRRVEAPEEPLTEQEARIARLVCEGGTNRAIGAQLFISPRTVEYHLHKVFLKFGVSSRTELARLMLESEDREEGGLPTDVPSPGERP